MKIWTGVLIVVVLVFVGWLIYQGGTVNYVATVESEAAALESELAELEAALASGELTPDEAAEAEEKIVARIKAIEEAIDSSKKATITEEQRAQLLVGLDRLKGILTDYQGTLTAVGEEAKKSTKRRGGGGSGGGQSIVEIIEEVIDTVEEYVEEVAEELGEMIGGEDTDDDEIMEEEDEEGSEGGKQPMTFFITSENTGTGADLGGLEGADQHCQALAEDAGVGDRTWRAYLSAVATENEEAVNARDRIGEGPWHNHDGELIASSVADLHNDNNSIDKETGLSEMGEMINGRGDEPNLHDILTGSNADGTVAVGEEDTTCSNWTSEGEGSAVVGHHDRLGPDTLETATSWNAAHGSRGCSLEDLNSTGGGGLLYCFAI